MKKICYFIIITIFLACNHTAEIEDNILTKKDITKNMRGHFVEYGKEIKQYFGEFPLNIIIEISKKNNDSLLLRYAYLSKSLFDSYGLKNKVWMSERINSINLYYFTECKKEKNFEKMISFNPDIDYRDVYFYAKEMVVVSGKIADIKNIEWSKIKWLSPPPPPKE